MSTPQERAFEAAVTILVKLLDTKPTTFADVDTLESLIRTFHLDRKAVKEEAYKRRKRRGGKLNEGLHDD